MRLTYHRGKNFGDALNPIIFNHLLPGFFTEESDLELLGIGSILGLKRPRPQTKKVIVYSSGFGGGDPGTYGALPNAQDLTMYDFRCVRGPLTQQALGLTKDKAVCDGAILLSEVIPPIDSKKYRYSYIPHLGSLKYYGHWKELLAQCDINLIDPTQDVFHVVEEIQQSEVLLAEAMHGAIIADAYRVPWVPVKSNKTINEFKWRDFCLSLDLEFKVNEVPTLYDREVLVGIFKEKIAPIQSSLLTDLLAGAMKSYQGLVTEKQVLTAFNSLKQERTMLSDDGLLNRRKSALLDVLYGIQKDYGHSR